MLQKLPIKVAKLIILTDLINGAVFILMRIFILLSFKSFGIVSGLAYVGNQKNNFKDEISMTYLNDRVID